MRTRPPSGFSRWLAAGVVFGGLGLAYPGCSNKPTYVCEVLDDCKLLRGSVDDCIDNVELAYDAEELIEGEVGHCLDCVVEHSCKDVETICFEGPCHEVIAAIDKAHNEMGSGGSAGASGAAGQSGEP